MLLYLTPPKRGIYWTEIALLAQHAPLTTRAAANELAPPTSCPARILVITGTRA